MTDGAFNFWYDMYNALVQLLVVVMVIFVLHFIGKQQWLSKPWVRLTLLGMLFGMVWLDWQTSWVYLRGLDLASSSWGYYLQGAGPWLPLTSSIVMAGFLVPIILVARYYWQVEEPVKKHEVGIVLAALIVGVVPGTVFEGLLPQILHQSSAFPASTIGSVFSAAMIVYAITRYGLHLFNLDNVLSNILEVMPGGLVILDHTHSIQYMSADASAMLGYPDGKLVGASVRKLFQNTESYGAFQTGVLAQLAPDSTVASKEIELWTRGRQQFPVSLNAVSVYYGNELVNQVISFTDIRPVKRAEAELQSEKADVQRKVVARTRELFEAQAQLTASIRSLPFGFAIVNHKGEIAFTNSLFGQLLDQDIPSDPKASRGVLRDLSKRLSPGIDLLERIKESQHKLKKQECKLAFGPRFYRFVFMPILRTAADKTEHALGTVILVEDTTEALALERSRDEFFSIASHELRTPLTAIRGNTGMMLDYYSKELSDPTLRTMVDDVHDASIRLINIVNDFLDSSRLEQGKITFDNQPFDVVPLIHQLLRQYDVTGSRRKLYLRVEPSPDPVPLVVGDADRTRQIITNLLGNAIRSTQKGGVSIKFSKRLGNLAIEVTDTGHGIPVESQHLLFHKFQQASHDILTRDSTHGTGLGLYISSLLAEGMEGELYLAHTEEDKGSTFVLELPIAKR